MRISRLRLLAVFRWVWLLGCMIAAGGIAALWLRSSHWEEHVRYSPSNGTDFEAVVASGRLFLSWEDVSDSPYAAGFDHWSREPRSWTSVTGATTDAWVERSYEREWNMPFSPPAFIGFSFQSQPRTATFPGLPLAQSHARLKWLFPNSSWVQFGLPLWLLETIVCVPLVMRGISVLRRKRRKPGLCRHCGYDLRATPNRCPECGTLPAQV